MTGSGARAYPGRMTGAELHQVYVDAVAQAGGPVPYSRIVGRSRQAVYKSLGRSGPMPPEHVVKVAAALRIPRGRLRPDLYPEEADAT